MSNKKLGLITVAIGIAAIFVSLTCAPGDRDITGAAFILGMGMLTSENKTTISRKENK